MKQRKVHTEFAEAMHGEEFFVIARNDEPKYASKLVCKRCGKEYLPGSLDAIDRHERKHILEDVEAGILA